MSNADIDLNEEKLSALRLIRSENIGIKTFFSLIKLFDSPIKAINKVQELSIRGGKKKPIKLYSKENVFKEIEKSYAYGASIIYYKDISYPGLLKNIVDFPPIITVLGKDLDILKKDSISIVGSRNASLNGTRFAYKIAKELSDSGYIITSGLAKGIDTYAHKGSLDNGTVAVIAGGIDNIYPFENYDLYKNISNQGVIISENPFGALPKAQNFPQRNRIVSGLSKATIVIEASIKSGSLITANFALEQNREIFAVPGFPLDSRHSGTNKLIKQGAYLFETVEDLFNIIHSSYNNNRINQTSIDENQNSLHDQIIAIDDKNLEKDLDKLRDLILSKLSTTATNIDELYRSIKVPFGLLMLSILELELAGKLQRVRNNEIILLKE